MLCFLLTKGRKRFVMRTGCRGKEIMKSDMISDIHRFLKSFLIFFQIFCAKQAILFDKNSVCVQYDRCCYSLVEQSESKQSFSLFLYYFNFQWFDFIALIYCPTNEQMRLSALDFGGTPHKFIGQTDIAVRDRVCADMCRYYCYKRHKYFFFPPKILQPDNLTCWAET